MKRIVLIFGLISGGFLAVVMPVSIHYLLEGTFDFTDSQLVGYTSMVIAFLAVFFGIRSYRENVAGGTISFGKAFKVGILIALVTCACYVIAWEIIYWGFMPDFGDKYAAMMLDKMRADGVPAAEIAKTSQEMEKFKVWYRNPFFNVGMTFLEVFPVGLIMTLVSAGILRKKPEGQLAMA